MHQEDFDILLLDRMLPAKDGIEICRRVCEISSILIIPLTAKDAAADKVCGLDNGADGLPQKLSQKTKHLLRSGVHLHVAEADGTVHTDDMSRRDTLKRCWAKRFGRFYHIATSRSKHTGETGLGLAIAKWIADEHGAAISLASENGCGTHSSVCFPSVSPAKKNRRMA